MGFEHRLIGLSLLLVVAGGVAACSGKEVEQEQKRKALLVPQDLAAKRTAADDAARTQDDQGNLLASTTKVAGLLLPRGFTVVSTDEYDWYVEGRVALPKLEKYLRDHLVIGSEQHPAKYKIDFTQAQPKDTPGAKPIFVSFYPRANRFDISRMYIHAPRPRPSYFPAPEEVQAQMKARAEHAD